MFALFETLKGFLSLKNSDDNEDDDSQDICHYTQLINSSKYAESNSNTEALERLVKSMDLEDVIPSASLKKEPERHDAWSLPEALDRKVDLEDQIYQSKNNQEILLRLSSHIKLLKDLENESACVLPGQPVYQPPRFGRDGVKFVLRNFPVPDYIYDAMFENNAIRLGLQQQLTTENYVRRFQTLLWVEEAHQAIEMHRYDLESVMLGRFGDGDLFLLVVPGLAEGRPSLLRGDRLVLKSNKRQSVYEGYIHEVREHDILIKLHESLHSTAMDGLRFDVSFISSRTPFKRCHHAIVQVRERSRMMRSIVFPTPLQNNDDQLKPKINPPETSAEDLRCFMGCLNIYQRRAVINVLKSEARPAPYIIFGPPGTGKTVTMVEAVLQVYARHKDSKILVCGNSNSCADLLAKRIQDSQVVPLKKMVRLSAFYRMEKLIPPELKEVTKDMDMISSEMYNDYRIVISTCIHSGALNEFRARFDYVFIDEAGHANEAEALISIGMMKEGGSVVLAGDPHQLGPVVVSQLACQNGLGVSFLERLSRRSVYLRTVRNGKMAYDSRYVTKLIISYRCDARVMVVNNKLFYDNELKFVAETPQFWMDFLGVTQPLVFHPVRGRDRREFVNPSWFNPAEAITCLSYVKRLYGAGLKPEQLGIITPYRRQIEKLNLLFDSCNLRKCKISTMEEFQGDEREVIIISTVRTREKNLDFDIKFQLGFLFNPKRFNVAISRAKWLVIVVGDSNMLNRDSYWALYIELAHKVDPTTDLK